MIEGVRCKGECYFTTTFEASIPCPSPADFCGGGDSGESCSQDFGLLYNDHMHRPCHHLTREDIWGVQNAECIGLLWL